MAHPRALPRSAPAPRCLRPVTLSGPGAPPAAITSSPTPSPLARASVYLLDDEFAVNRGSSLVSFNAAKGAERWRLTTPLTFPALLRAGPGVTGDTVYVGADDGALYAVDATSGAQRWRFDATGWRPSGIFLDSFKSVESPVLTLRTGRGPAGSQATPAAIRSVGACRRSPRRR